jgi:hypothetical protein
MVVEQPTAARLLEQWRAAERRRDTLMPGSAEHDTAAAECDLLAEAYRDLLIAQRDAAQRLDGLRAPGPPR